MPPTEAKMRHRPKPEERTAKSTKKNSKSPKNVEETKKNKFAAAHAELQTATSSTTHRIWTRSVVILSVSVLVYFYANQGGETKFALVRENLTVRSQKFRCDSWSFTHGDMENSPHCVPYFCGRFVTDEANLDRDEIESLLDMAQRVFSKTSSSGGASILDIHSGAVSMGADFVNAFKIPHLSAEILNEHLITYQYVKDKVQRAIAEQFGIPLIAMYPTSPIFFSRLTNVTAKTIHDEYWHEHVDKDTYPSYHYTALLYLNTYGKDFEGGRFIFVDGGEGKNRKTAAIEPKTGRINAFTSGAENRHFVEPVTSGERYAVTISFTCNFTLSIGDPYDKHRKPKLKL